MQALEAGPSRQTGPSVDFCAVSWPWAGTVPVCVLGCVHMSVCAHMSVHAHVCTCTCEHVHVHLWARASVWAHVCVHACASACTCVCVHVSVGTRVHLCLCVRVCVLVCLCACVCVCTCVWQQGPCDGLGARRPSPPAVRPPLSCCLWGWRGVVPASLTPCPEPREQGALAQKRPRQGGSHTAQLGASLPFFEGVLGTFRRTMGSPPGLCRLPPSKGTSRGLEAPQPCPCAGGSHPQASGGWHRATASSDLLASQASTQDPAATLRGERVGKVHSPLLFSWFVCTELHAHPKGRVWAVEGGGSWVRVSGQLTAWHPGQ